MLAKTVIISSEQPQQVATVLKLQPPQKHVDKSQKQQFVVEFPPEVTQMIGSVCMINVDRKHFLPPVLLTGIAKQQKEEKKNINNFPIQGELSIQILSREDKEITFEKCERCQEKDSHIFPLYDKLEVPEEREQHPRNCFALIGCDKLQFEKGKALIPVYFRCCPTHHTSKKGENFVRMKVRIIKGSSVYESEFMKVQWKKGKHNRTTNGVVTTTTVTSPTPNKPIGIQMPSLVPQPSVNSISSIVTANTRESAFTPQSVNINHPPPSPNTQQASTTNSTPSSNHLPPPQVAKPTPQLPNKMAPSPPSNQNMIQLPSILGSNPLPHNNSNNSFNNSPFSNSNNPLNNLASPIGMNAGVPPYQAYMNMFQHLQTYYVQPLEEENKKLRSELAELNRNVGHLKEENRKIKDISQVGQKDDHFLDQLRNYQYEVDCCPSFLSYESDEEVLTDTESNDKEEFEDRLIKPYGRKTMREAIKFMKFKSNMKLILLKHNGTQWFEPLDRLNTTNYVDGDRIGIRIVNKNSFPVYVRLHKINYSNNQQHIPLSREDFYRVEGCRDSETKWEPVYFDLGTVHVSRDPQVEAIELLKLLVTTSPSYSSSKLSVILTKSYAVKSN